MDTFFMKYVDTDPDFNGWSQYDTGIYTVESGKLYEAYHRHCENLLVPDTGQDAFDRAISALGFKKTRILEGSLTKWYWRSIRLKPDVDRDAEPTPPEYKDIGECMNEESNPPPAGADPQIKVIPDTEISAIYDTACDMEKDGFDRSADSIYDSYVRHGGSRSRDDFVAFHKRKTRG